MARWGFRDAYLSTVEIVLRNEKLMFLKSPTLLYRVLGTAIYFNFFIIVTDFSSEFKITNPNF